MTQRNLVTTLEKNIYTVLIRFIASIADRFFKSSFVLLGVAFVTLDLAFKADQFFPKQLGTFDGQKITSIVFLVLFTCLVCFALPAATSKLFLREKLKDLGLIFPPNKLKALLLILAALLLLLPFIFILAKRPEFQRHYSLAQPNLTELIFLNVFLFPLYYFTEEFFYRGYLFLGLWKRLKWHSFWITDIFFAFAHLGKPGYEILLSMFASVVFNVITLSSRSILPAMITHWIMGTTLIILVNAH